MTVTEMDRSERAIFTNMCMVCDGEGRVLVQDRQSPDWPGVTFPGGHVEPGESFTQSVIREVREETGLTVEHPRLCGIKQFQAEQGARYVVLLYRADRFSGTLTSSDEGEVFWVERGALGRCRLSADSQEMLKVFECCDLSEFYYYRDGEAWAHALL